MDGRNRLSAEDEPQCFLPVKTFDLQPRDLAEVQVQRHHTFSLDMDADVFGGRLHLQDEAVSPQSAMNLTVE